MTEPHLHEYPVEIQADDIDFMGHVNNASYLKWIQAAVVDHWQRIASSQALANYQWIALKHEITYRKPALLTDRLVAHLRLESVKRESAFYETVVRRGEEVISTVKSRWCCISQQSKRPVRITDAVKQCFFPTAPAAS